MKLIELQVLGGARIGKFRQESLSVKRFGDAGKLINVSGLSIHEEYGGLNGVYELDGILNPNDVGSNYWKRKNSDGWELSLSVHHSEGSEVFYCVIVASGKPGGSTAATGPEITGEPTFPWISWPEVCTKITEQFELSKGSNKLLMSDSDIMLNADRSGSALPFTSSNLSSNLLTIAHSAGRKFVTGLACTVWPKSVSYVSESQLQLDFTGVEVSGTQYVWFDGIEGAQIQ